MQTSCDWQDIVRESVAELLARAGWQQPPVDALEIARVMRITVAWDFEQANRGRIKRIAGQPAIFLKPEERPERIQWAAAHELGESMIWQLCGKAGISADELTPPLREQLANRFATELLLPDRWFFRDSSRCAADLRQLKEIYVTASHELIAWRWLDGETPGIVTLYDQGVRTRRRSNLAGSCPPVSPLEQECLTWMRRTRLATTRTDRRFTVRGWCIDTSAWQREILYLVWQDEGE